MNKQDDLITQLYKQRKAKAKTSKHVKQQFVDGLMGQNKPQLSVQPWYVRSQFALSFVAVSFLALMLFNQWNQNVLLSLTEVDVASYQHLASIEQSDQGLTWSMAQNRSSQKERLEQNYHQQLNHLNRYLASKSRDFNNEEVIVVQLVQTGANWFFETCDGDTLISAHEDIIAQLTSQADNLKDMRTGQWLAFALDNQGLPSSLYKANVNQCV